MKLIILVLLSWLVQPRVNMLKMHSNSCCWMVSVLHGLSYKMVSYNIREFFSFFGEKECEQNILKALGIFLNKNNLRLILELGSNFAWLAIIVQDKTSAN